MSDDTPMIKALSKHGRPEPHVRPHAEVSGGVDCLCWSTAAKNLRDLRDAGFTVLPTEAVEMMIQFIDVYIPASLVDVKKAPINKAYEEAVHAVSTSLKRSPHPEWCKCRG